MMINLHMHTNCSDGVLCPEQLYEKIKLNNIDVASITDHDTVLAYDTLSTTNSKDQNGILLIPGLEMKCTHNGYSVEILGYFINPERLKQYLDDKRIKVAYFQQYSFECAKKVCRKLNLKFDDQPLLPGQYAGSEIFNMLNKYHDYNANILGDKVMESPAAFYRLTLINQTSDFYVSEEELGYFAQETIDQIHGAGGLAFLAHIGQYRMIEDKISFLDSLSQSTNIDGIECYYPVHNDYDTRMYIEYCRQNHLLISGGSDYHGTPSQNIILQTNIDPENLDWVYRLK